MGDLATEAASGYEEYATYIDAFGLPSSELTTTNRKHRYKSPGACFSKLPVITGPVKLFCFPFQMGVSKLLKIIQ